MRHRSATSQPVKNMSKATKFLATALIAAGVSATAQATPIIIDFADLAGCSTPETPTCKASTQYAGLSFSPNNVAHTNAVNDFTAPLTPRAEDSPTFLRNSADGASFFFEILAGYHLSSLTLDAAANSGGVSIFMVDVNGGTSTPFEITNGLYDWQYDEVIDLPSAAVARVEFQTTSAGRFAIDYLRLDLTPPTPSPPPTIPEPASAGLVILALLGAAASRCRKQA